MTKLLTESDNLLKNNSELHGLIVIVRKKQLAAIALKEKVKGVAKGTKSSKGGNSKSATSLDRPEGKDQKEEKEEESKKQTVDDGKPKILQPLVTIYINRKPYHPTSMESLLQKQQQASVSDHTTDGTKGKESKIDTPVIETPPDTIADKLNFIINNSTDTNVQQKVREAREVLEPKFFKWLANQLVVKRICTQPNYHPTYLKFMTLLKMNDFEDAVLECTYDNIRKLLSSEKIQTSTQDRSLLKKYRQLVRDDYLGTRPSCVGT